LNGKRKRIEPLITRIRRMMREDTREERKRRLPRAKGAKTQREKEEDFGFWIFDFELKRKRRMPQEIDC